MTRYRVLATLNSILAVTLLTTWFTTNSFADPLTGRDLLKFSQKPMNLTPIQDIIRPEGSEFPHFGSGESKQHRELKNFIKANPGIVGAGDDWDSFVEFPLPSLDQIDVLFKSKAACIAVEVKSSLSDSFIRDYERGVYQVIKYDALLRSMSIAGEYGIPMEIRTLLVLESKLQESLKKLAKKLGVSYI